MTTMRARCAAQASHALKLNSCINHIMHLSTKIGSDMSSATTIQCHIPHHYSMSHTPPHNAPATMPYAPWYPGSNFWSYLTCGGVPVHDSWQWMGLMRQPSPLMTGCVQHTARLAPQVGVNPVAAQTLTYI